MTVLQCLVRTLNRKWKSRILWNLRVIQAGTIQFERPLFIVNG